MSRKLAANPPPVRIGDRKVHQVVKKGGKGIGRLIQGVLFSFFDLRKTVDGALHRGSRLGVGFGGFMVGRFEQEAQQQV
ncbi:hypothetical protein SDC9_211247 [bioreactor metagenome]|uniref:Uncharacterized protein n=1 Tax=bioreactor metagenome TaxID=1076179 RepID=A0A645JII3_9ZZZZ